MESKMHLVDRQLVQDLTENPETSMYAVASYNLGTCIGTLFAMGMTEEQIIDEVRQVIQLCIQNGPLIDAAVDRVTEGYEADRHGSADGAEN